MKNLIKKLFNNNNNNNNNNKNNREELILLSEFILSIELMNHIEERGSNRDERELSLKESLEIIEEAEAEQEKYSI